jgi:hypothetical protein
MRWLLEALFVVMAMAALSTSAWAGYKWGRASVEVRVVYVDRPMVSPPDSVSCIQWATRVWWDETYLDVPNGADTLP